MKSSLPIFLPQESMLYEQDYSRVEWGLAQQESSSQTALGSPPNALETETKRLDANNGHSGEVVGACSPSTKGRLRQEDCKSEARASLGNSEL